MITIQLYNYSGQKNILNKTLSGNTPVNGTFKGDFDIMNPTIEVSYSFSSMVEYKNYCSLRYSTSPFSGTLYYYIVDIIQKENGIIELRLHLDVLMSFRGYIEQAVMLKVATDSSDANKLIHGEVPVNVNDSLSTYVFNRQIFNTDALTIILSVAGGDASV